MILMKTRRLTFQGAFKRTKISFKSQTSKTIIHLLQHYWHNVLCRGESFGRTHFLRFNDFGKRGRFKRDLEEGLTTIKEVEWMGVVWQ